MWSNGQLEHLPNDALTERELEILVRLSQGLSNREIAQALFLAPETVKWHNKQIFQKLAVHNRAQAVSRGSELGLLKSGSVAASAETHNLPAEVTSFVGRTRELAELGRLMQRTRLLTITGLGGSGKTRLALHAAASYLSTFPDGVIFVPLSTVPSASAMLWAIGTSVNFRFQQSPEPLQQLLFNFRDKRMLLVLDNMDHLLSETGLLVDILRAAPGVTIIATSRERLSVYGEVNFPIAGLELPEFDGPHPPSRSEAVELFLDRARTLRPDLEWESEGLEHAYRICRAVEGMPLGIELAATWVEMLTVQEIAHELERGLEILESEQHDAAYGQHSMRSAFNRSWDLLEETQRQALQRLVVFRGGFTREAASAIAGVDLRTLKALVSKSLIRRLPQTGRYDIHELLRHFAHERLLLSGESEAICEAHAAYFAQFVAARWPRLKDHRQKTALMELEADIENARTAWRYWVNAQDVARLREFLHSFWAIHDIRGWYAAGAELFDQALQVMQSSSSEEAAAITGWLYAVQGLYFGPSQNDDFSPDEPPPVLAEFGVYSARGYSRHDLAMAMRGVQLLKQLQGFDDLMIVPLISLFTIASQLGEEHDLSLQAAVDCLELATRIGDRWAIAKAKQFLTVMAIEAGEYEKGERLAYETLAAFQANGDHWSISVVCIEVFGMLEITRRHYESAKAWLKRGLKAAEEIDFKYSIQTAYWQLGFVSALEENYVDAGKYWHLAQQVTGMSLGRSSFIGFGRVGNEMGGRKLTTVGAKAQEAAGPA